MTCGGTATGPDWSATWSPPFPVAALHALAHIWHDLLSRLSAWGLVGQSAIEGHDRWHAAAVRLLAATPAGVPRTAPEAPWQPGNAAGRGPAHGR